jgi:hypothetical protein
MNTMSRFAMVAAAVALLAPAITRADTGVADDNACVTALMASLAETYHPAPRLRSVALADLGGSPLDNGGAAEWTLTAVNPRTNLPVARVNCLTNAAGEVVEFRQEPVF